MNHIHINYEGMRPYLQEAVIKTNELLRSWKFYELIAQQANFDLADISPRQIADLMQQTTLDMTVDLYYSMSPFKNIDGYDDPEHTSVIHMNIWKIERPVASLCNTMIHFCVHAVNALHDEYYFGHGDNSLTGKENTAPYRIGYLAQNMICKDDKSIIVLEHDRITSGKVPIKDHLPVH